MGHQSLFTKIAKYLGSCSQFVVTVTPFPFSFVGFNYTIYHNYSDYRIFVDFILLHNIESTTYVIINYSISTIYIYFLYGKYILAGTQVMLINTF